MLISVYLDDVYVYIISFSVSVAHTIYIKLLLYFYSIMLEIIAGMANFREVLLFLMTWLMTGVWCAQQPCSDGSNCCHYSRSCKESHELRYVTLN